MFLFRRGSKLVTCEDASPSTGPRACVRSNPSLSATAGSKARASSLELNTGSAVGYGAMGMTQERIWNVAMRSPGPRTPLRASMLSNDFADRLRDCCAFQDGGLNLKREAVECGA